MTAPHRHWSPNLHPKYPKGTPGGLGGQFMPVGSAHYAAAVNSQAAPAGSSVVPAPSGGWVAAVQGLHAAGPTLMGGTPGVTPAPYAVVNGFYFPAGKKVSTASLGGAALQAALLHNAVQPTGTRVASAKATAAAVSAGKYHAAHQAQRQAASATVRAQFTAANPPPAAPAPAPSTPSAPSVPSPSPSTPSPGIPTPPAASQGAPSNSNGIITLVQNYYFPTGQVVRTIGLSGKALAAASAHNQSLPANAPVSFGFTPIPVKTPAHNLYGRSPHGLVQVSGYYFPAGQQVPVKGLAGTRRAAALLHNQHILNPGAQPAAPSLIGHKIATPKVTIASTTYAPHVGSDIRSTLDYAALAASGSSNFGGWSGASQQSGYGIKGDSMLYDIYTAAGYHQVPEMVDEAEIDKRLANGEGWVELFRGVNPSYASGSVKAKSKKKIQDEFRDGPAHYAGFGMYGNGSYAGDIQTVVGSYTSRDTPYSGPGSQRYGGIPAGAIDSKKKPVLSHPYWDMKEWDGLVRMALRPDARVITHRTLKNLQKQMTAGAPKNQQTVFADEGHLAAALGYDAIKVTQAVGSGGVAYHVILNRSAVVVQKPPHRP